MITPKQLQSIGFTVDKIYRNYTEYKKGEIIITLNNFRNKEFIGINGAANLEIKTLEDLQKCLNLDIIKTQQSNN